MQAAAVAAVTEAGACRCLFVRGRRAQLLLQSLLSVMLLLLLLVVMIMSWRHLAVPTQPTAAVCQLQTATLTVTRLSTWLTQQQWLQPCCLSLNHLLMSAVSPAALRSAQQGQWRVWGLRMMQLWHSRRVVPRLLCHSNVRTHQQQQR